MDNTTDQAAIDMIKKLVEFHSAESEAHLEQAKRFDAMLKAYENYEDEPYPYNHTNSPEGESALQEVVNTIIESDNIVQKVTNDLLNAFEESGIKPPETETNPPVSETNPPVSEIKQPEPAIPVQTYRNLPRNRTPEAKAAWIANIQAAAKKRKEAKKNDTPIKPQSLSQLKMVLKTVKPRDIQRSVVPDKPATIVRPKAEYSNRSPFGIAHESAF